MKLPNFAAAVVAEDKLGGYLLSPTHRDGKYKAAFFLAMGFLADAGVDLALALREHAAAHEVTRVENSPFGVRYVVEGILQTPVGRTPQVRAVWFIETGDDVPRFVTAYPLKKVQDDQGT